MLRLDYPYTDRVCFPHSQLQGALRTGCEWDLTGTRPLRSRRTLGFVDTKLRANRADCHPCRRQTQSRQPASTRDGKQEVLCTDRPVIQLARLIRGGNDKLAGFRAEPLEHNLRSVAPTFR